MNQPLPQRAVLTLQDNNSGSYTAELAFWPNPPAGHSPAVKMARDLVRLLTVTQQMEVATAARQTTPAATPALRVLPDPKPARDEWQREAFATLLGFAWRIGRSAELREFIFALRAQELVPSLDPEHWPTEVLVHVRVLFQSQTLNPKS